MDRVTVAAGCSGLLILLADCVYSDRTSVELELHKQTIAYLSPVRPRRL